MLKKNKNKNKYKIDDDNDDDANYATDYLFYVEKFWRTVRDQRSTASHIDNVDVANDDNDVTSCSDSTPGCSRQCSAVATATVAMSPPPCDVIVDSGSEENDAVTPADRQVRVGTVMSVQY